MARSLRSYKGCCKRRQIVGGRWGAQLLLLVAAMGIPLFVLITSSSPAAAAAQAHQTPQGVVHVVGDAQGWTLPNASLNYTSWAHSTTFHVGDTALFVYQSSLHNVLQVSKDDYEQCNSDTPLSSFTDGNTSIPLTKAGMWYFICGLPNHCEGGQKVALTCLKSSYKTLPVIENFRSPMSPSKSTPYFTYTPPSSSIPSVPSSPITFNPPTSPDISNYPPPIPSYYPPIPSNYIPTPPTSPNTSNYPPITPTSPDTSNYPPIPSTPCEHTSPPSSFNNSTSPPSSMTPPPSRSSSVALRLSLHTFSVEMIILVLPMALLFLF